MLLKESSMILCCDLQQYLEIVKFNRFEGPAFGPNNTHKSHTISRARYCSASARC